MRTMRAVVAALLILACLGTGVAVAQCRVPAILVTGKAYDFLLSDGLYSVFVFEIDRPACWVKGRYNRNFGGDLVSTGLVWFNLNQVLHITELEPSSPQANPEQ